MPEGANLIVVSRNEPPAEFARLRAGGSLSEIGWEELRLTREETEAIASLRGECREDAARELHERSEGWAAGLTLLMQQGGSASGVPDALRGASPQALFDYFAAEVFDRAAGELRQLWLRTAYLPRFTVESARKLSGSEAVERLLDTLYRQRCFIERRSASAATYQYHPLFQAFLRHRVDRAYTEAERQRLAHRSALALREQGDHEVALILFGEAGDWSSAAELTLQQAAPLFAQGRWQTLQGWIGALPRMTVETTPWLLYWAGACQAQSDPPGGRATIEQAYARFVDNADVVGQALCACAVLESHYVEWGNFAQRDKWIGVLERVLAQDPVFPSTSVQLRVWSCLLLALSYLRPQDPLAPVCVERVWALCRSELPACERLMPATWLLCYLSTMEGMERAGAVVTEFGALARSPEVPPLQRVLWSWTHMMYYSNVFEIERWRRSNREAQEIATQAGLDLVLGSLRLFEAWAMLEAGDLGAARRGLEHLAHEIDRARPNDIALYHFLLSWLALLEDRPRTALDHAGKSAAIVRELGSVGPIVSSHGSYSQALAQCGDMEQALAVARGATAWVDAPGAGALRFNALLFEADVLCRLGRREEFLATLAEAFATGRRGGLLNNVQWLPEMMSRLCAEALAAGIESEYVERLIAKRGLVPPGPNVQSWPWPLRIYTLGRFALVREGKPLQPAGKPQHRPLELFKALIALGGRQVHGEALIEALWPDAAGIGARKTLQMTLKRLRELLGSAEAIMLHDGKLTLEPGRCWVDVWALERSLNRAGDALARGGGDSGAGAAEHALVQALALYQGHFLAGEPEHPWLVGMRERLRSRFLRTLREACLRLEQRQRFKEAQALLERALEIDPVAEELYRRLMLCLRALGRRAEAIEVYRRCRRQLSIVLGIAPSAETEAVHRSLLCGE